MEERKSAKPTQERLHELFHYDPETGLFVRKSSVQRGPKERKYGRVGAGRISELGYVLLMIDGVNYIAGQVAWAYVHGAWPHARIKYIDGNKLNNRIDNIRVQDRDREEVKSERLSLERLKELLHYEPSTGWFTWRVNTSVAKPGERAGSGHGLGYRQIGLDYKKYLEHSLAVFYMTGEWPTSEVDHKNRDKSDNSWDNLIHATRSENGHNKGQHRRTSTGFPGVMVHGNKYRSRIDVKPGRYDLGCYKTLAEARVARLLSEKAHFGRFTTWSHDRDSILPYGDRKLTLMAAEDHLFAMIDGVPVEIIDVNQLRLQ